MAAVRLGPLFLTLLLLLGSERVSGTTLACNAAIASCLTSYTASSLANVLNPNSCEPYNTLKACTKTVVSANTCTQEDINGDSALNAAFATKSHCSGADLAKSSLLSLVVAALIALLVKA